MTDELLTIKEVAQRAGVSTQAIYQRLDKDLNPYLQVVDNKKCLKIEVLELFSKSSLQEHCKEDYQALDKDLQSDFQAVIETLREQLSQKDKQIETLQGELMEQNAHVRKQSEKLVALVEQVNELQRNNQILLKAEQDRYRPKELQSDTVEADPRPSPVFNTEGEEGKKEQPKEGLWKRLKSAFKGSES